MSKTFSFRSALYTNFEHSVAFKRNRNASSEFLVEGSKTCSSSQPWPSAHPPTTPFSTHLVAGLVAGKDKHKVADIISGHVGQCLEVGTASKSLLDPPGSVVHGLSQLLHGHITETVRDVGTLWYSADLPVRSPLRQVIDDRREEFAASIFSGLVCHCRIRCGKLEQKKETQVSLDAAEERGMIAGYLNYIVGKTHHHRLLSSSVPLY